MTLFDPSLVGDLERRIAALVKLAENEDACRLLGVEGALEPQLDLTFVDDPLEWLAYDLATAIRNAEAEESGEEEEPGPTLTMLVAEFKLFRLVAGEIGIADLAARVQEQLKEG